MPAFVPHFVTWWAALYSGSAVLRTVVAFFHVAGLVGGGGAAIAADRATLRATRRGVQFGRHQIDAIHNTHRVVLYGLAAVIVSGVLLFAADVDTYAPSKLFWIKMGMVAALMLNGAMLVRVGRNNAAADERTRRTLRWTAAVSLSLWFLTTLVGAGLPNI
jgi:uncharacterized membrane protein